MCVTVMLMLLNAEAQPYPNNGIGSKTTGLEALIKTGRLKMASAQPLKTLADVNKNKPISFPKKMPSKISGEKKAVPQKVSNTSTGAELWGVIIYRDSWKDLDDWSKPYGIYGTKAGETTFTSFVEDPYYLNMNGCGAFFDDKFHGISYSEYDGVIYYLTYMEYETENWTQTDNSWQYIYDSSLAAYATAYSSTDGKVYAYMRGNEGAMNFGTIDYSSLTTSVISEADRVYVAMSADAEGNIYAIGLDGNLYSISKQTGESTLIGTTGVTPSSVLQSATIDQNSGIMYWAAINSDNTSSLYQVDTTSGAASKINDFADNEEIVCLYAPVSANPLAPSPAANLTFDFADGSLSGNVMFDIPTTCSDGSTLSGTVNYTITEGSDVLATGSESAGSSVSANVTLASSGIHEISVILSNSEGDSKKTTSKTSWIGPDVPLSPDEISLTIDSERHAVLTWTAVTEGENGGYIDPNGVTYKIIRKPDDVVVAENISDTRFEETLPETTYQAYYYTVTTYNKGVESSFPSSSNKVKTGTAFTVPYFEDFNEVEDLNLFEVIDGNNDNSYWKYAYGNVSNRHGWRAETAADDWLITPPIHLLDQRAYYFIFRARCGEDESTRRVGASFGQGIDPDNYTEIIAPTVINSSQYTSLEKLVCIDAEGDYRFGIHDTSDPEMMELFVDSIEVVAGPLYSAPDSVTNLVVTPGANGALNASISFVTPTKTFNNGVLDKITKVEVVRDNDIPVHTFTEASTGSTLTCTDNGENLTDGWHTYTVTAYNEDGLGLKRSITAYIGTDIPSAPINVSIKDNLDGTATMTWDVSNVGINGGYVDKDGLTYNIYTLGDEELVPVGTSDNASYIISGLPVSGEQTLYIYAVAGVSKAGAGSYGATSIVVGGNYTLPFHESFPQGEMENSFWMATSAGNGSFQTYDSMSEDGDGGCIGFVAGAMTDSASVCTGKIELGTEGSPKLLFYYYSLPNATADLTVKLTKNGQSEYTTLKTIDIASSGTTGWTPVIVDLSQYKSDNGYVNIWFCASTKGSDSPVIIDNISIDEVAEYNLSATIVAPSIVNSGAEGEFEVNVYNIGSNDANGAVVELYADEEAVDTKTINVAAYMSEKVKLHYTPTPASPESMKFHAIVKYDGDSDTSDNATDTCEVKIMKKSLPTVEGLSGTVGEGGTVTLSWGKPLYENYKTLEDFESYEPFTIANVGDWTLVDVDGGPTTSIYGASSFAHSQEPFAYIVFNPEEDGLDTMLYPAYSTKSGSQYMAAFASIVGKTAIGHNDDWLISPELSGEAQTISFFAKSVDDSYGQEAYEVLYSTTDREPESFVSVVSGTVPSGEWTEITAEIPDGAKYFAIRCVSEDCFIFMVDDVSYYGKPLTLNGYNIYRDDEYLASVNADVTTYTDTDVTEGTHKYAVTAVYLEGESKLSDPFSAITTVIDGISSDRLAINGADHSILISGADGNMVTVYGTDGRTIARAKANGRLVMRVPQGQYLVKIADKTYSISVN